MKYDSFIKMVNGKRFKVGFIKKNGEFREMVATLERKKPTKGIGLLYTPKDYDLVSVFDIEKQEYRMVNLKTIKYVKVLD